MDDEMVSITSDDAKKIAAELRVAAEMFVTKEPAHSQLLAHANLLDPPVLSLREELERALMAGYNGDWLDRTLNVIINRIESLKGWSGDPGELFTPDGYWLVRHEVTEMLEDAIRHEH